MLLATLFAAIVVNLAMFLVAYRLKTDKLTDASYAVSFILVAAFGLSRGPLTSSRVAIFLLVSLWALRLGGFLLYRIRKQGRDKRFDGMRENFWAFGRFWLLQGLSVWVVSLAASLMLGAARTYLDGRSFIGLAIWATGLGIETVADWQKWRFSQRDHNRHPWIDEGLWHYSRHPNYFGEMLVWIGIYLVALASLSPVGRFVALISPLYIMSLLAFVSGIPILEKNADKEWGSQASYREYKRRTSILVPLPPKR